MKVFATTWGQGKAFVLNQSCLYLGVYYICTSAHTAGVSFDATKFSLLNPLTTQYYDPQRDSFYRSNFFCVDAVYLELPDASGAVTQDSVLRLCNGGMDVKFSDAPGGTVRTWSAQGDFIGFSTITEEFDVKIGKFTIYLSGLGANMVNRFIDRDFEGKKVTIYKVFLDYNTLQPINNPYVVFEGIIYNVSVVESAITCSLNIECSTLWADFDRKAGRMTNDYSNWFFQGNRTDRAFTKANTVGQIEFKWGRI